MKLDLIEVLAVVTGALSVWWLARNRPIGWWVGLVSVAAFAIVFWRVRLYGDVVIQAIYFVTSVQALYVWRFGGRGRTERPVCYAPTRVLLVSLPIAIVGVVVLRAILIELNGAAPLLDSFVTVVAIMAQLYLMQRWVESWYAWVAVDLVYVPLYASRGLLLTSALDMLFLVLAVLGLLTFRRLAATRAEVTA